MSGERLPRRLVATGPARDELVAHRVIWSPEDTAELRRQLAELTELDRRRDR